MFVVQQQPRSWAAHKLMQTLPLPVERLRLQLPVQWCPLKWSLHQVLSQICPIEVPIARAPSGHSSQAPGADWFLVTCTHHCQGLCSLLIQATLIARSRGDRLDSAETGQWAVSVPTMLVKLDAEKTSSIGHRCRGSERVCRQLDRFVVITIVQTDRQTDIRTDIQTDRDGKVHGKEGGLQEWAT